MSLEVRKIFGLLVRPLVLTVVYTAFWFLVHQRFNGRMSQELTVLSLVMDCLGAIIGGTYGLHALFAGFALNRISNKQDIIERADAMGDLDEFLFYRNRRALDTKWRMLLLAQTLILLSLFLLAPIPLFWTSLLFLGLGCLPIFIFWEVAVELDDPFKGFSRINLYHPNWEHIDSNQHFRDKATSKAV